MAAVQVCTPRVGALMTPIEEWMMFGPSIFDLWSPSQHEFFQAQLSELDFDQRTKKETHLR